MPLPSHNQRITKIIFHLSPESHSEILAVCLHLIEASWNGDATSCSKLTETWNLLETCTLKPQDDSSKVTYRWHVETSRWRAALQPVPALTLPIADTLDLPVRTLRPPRLHLHAPVRCSRACSARWFRPMPTVLQSHLLPSPPSALDHASNPHVASFSHIGWRRQRAPARISCNRRQLAT